MANEMTELQRMRILHGVNLASHYPYAYGLGALVRTAEAYLEYVKQLSEPDEPESRLAAMREDEIIKLRRHFLQSGTVFTEAVWDDGTGSCRLLILDTESRHEVARTGEFMRMEDAMAEFTEMERLARRI